jgi:small subunit ribosomal protein S20
VPNIKQQEKRMRLAARQRLRNRQFTSSISTLFRRLQDCVDEHDLDGATAVAGELTARIDKAVSKGALHRNNAARKKSRAARIVATLSA